MMKQIERRTCARRAGVLGLVVLVSMLVPAPADATDTLRVSVSAPGVELHGNYGMHMVLSASGRFAAFAGPTNGFTPGDANGCMDVFVCDTRRDTLELASVDSTGVCGNAPSLWPSISANGRWVAFGSWANGLVADDDNGLNDIFVHDRKTGRTIIGSRSWLGSPVTSGDSLVPRIAANGKSVALLSYANDLVPGDSNGCMDVFLHEIPKQAWK